jgi:vacuolar-type H+-ATPase subunit F/Vma7
MELTVHVVCRSALAPGFELAGLVVDRAEDGASAIDEVNRLGEDPAVGVVLVEEQLHRALPEELVSRLDRQGQPIVASFPSPSWEGRSVAEDYVLEILRQAVGYRVRPR